jgi:Carboxypeptidase regulatory-like domain/TonB-dependent Receptor Plug Domain/TonB dependent receptor
MYQPNTPTCDLCTFSQSKQCKRIGLLACLALILGFALSVSPTALMAQTGGEAGIQGTVLDSTGAAIPNATITATNTATGVVTTRTTSAEGLYTIAPVAPGIYTVSAKADGFGGFTQQHLSIDALKLTGLNITLAVGSDAQEITVSEAPPALETTNAVLGGVMENHTYSQLPLQMNGQQRDPTQFAQLLPGVQAGTRAPIIGGTGNYLAEVYVDGLPITTINQQGDSRTVSNAIPVEAIDQFQVITSTPPAEYQGAGLINFTLKSGGSAYHGTAAGYVRNTIFDTWGFAAPALTGKDANGNTTPATKPVEHQYELVGAVGGPIPFTKKKGFFFASYDKFHGRQGINPNQLTVPTALMRTGDFSELGSTPVLFDPTTNSCTVSGSTTTCSRRPFMGLKNGQPTPNVIPSNMLSPIAAKMQSFLPAPTNGALTGNLLAGVPSGYDNHEFAARVDFDLTSRQRLSYVLTIGQRKNVPFTVGGTPPGVVLPLPYTAGGIATISPTIMDVEHSWAITEHLVNQFKYGFARFSQPITSLTDGVAGFQATDFGISNLPQGQASTEFPGATFGTNTAFPTANTAWTSNSPTGATQTTVPNAYTIVDNLQILKGSHAITAGIQVQWLEDNVANQLGPSGILTIPYNVNSTSNFAAKSSTLNTASTGYAYASYLLGAASASTIPIQAVSETGGRYHTYSPYVQDDWKVSQNLTLNLGLRWDYYPPFHEVQDRWSFLNPNLVNAATGNMGALQFAGNRGAGVSCNCRTPVNTWFKNFGPRIGLSYAARPTTIIRAGYALGYSHGGGVGGRGGAGNGTGALGFNASANSPADLNSGIGAGPSFYLNNSAGFQALGLANTGYGGPGYVLPVPTAPSVSSQTLNTGNYVNGAGAFQTANSITYADPYLSGRAPEFSFFNAGIQQALTNDLTLTVNYAGTQSHFLLTGGANARGYWANQLDPKYLAALGSVLATDGTPLLAAKPTPANVAILQAHGYNVPYSSFTSASSSSTIGQGLVAFPQYSTVSDLWGQNVGNVSYHALEVSLSQRPWHGLSYTANYTWSRNIGDDGTFRSGFNLPGGATSNGQSYKQNKIERSLTLTNVPQHIAIYGVYELPFGKGHLGGDNAIIRALASGWQFSSIYTYISGTPLAITYGGCTNVSTALAGQCEPDLNPAFSGNAHINGKFGKGITAANLSAISYIDKNAFAAPAKFGTASNSLSKIGTAPRTAAYNLNNPATWNIDASIRRTINLTPERLRFIFEVDGLNVANHPTFTNIVTAWGASNFGAVGGATGNRDFQFAGKLTF